MRTSLMTLTVSLCLAAGCDRQDEGCYDRSLTHVRIATAATSLPLPADRTPLVGSFTSWGPGEVVFETNQGLMFGFDLELEEGAALPDLHADSRGAVTLQGWDFTSSSSEPTEPTIAVSDDDGIVFMLGTGEWSAGEIGWSVTSPRDMNTCTTFTRDNGQGRNKPVFLTAGDESARLLQGDVTSLGGLDVTVLAAQSNNRNHPWAPCSTADCPWEKLSWMATRADLEMLIVP